MISRLDRITDWKSLAERAHYNVGDLAIQCGVTERQLRRYFYARFGVSPRAWMCSERLDKARRLLALDTSVKEVAFALGYKHHSSFSRVFRRARHATPRMMRRPETGITGLTMNDCK